MNKLSKAQIKRQLFWTNGCFRAAILEHYDGYLSKAERRYTHQELYYLIKNDWREEIDLEVHLIYMKKVLALDSTKLSLIVEAFQNGQQYRKQETIDAIMTELFERSADPETKEKHESKI
jgi:hypothetical protein